MSIHEVCSIVGLTRKSVRYYESVGLLNPRRNTDNDYRIYNEEDIKTLKIIKFLRELDVPIDDLKRIKKKELSLQDCLKDRINKIEREEENYLKIKNMCFEIIKENASIENINISKYFSNMNILNKKGFTMRNTKTSKTKKIIAAILVSLLFMLFLGGILGMISYFQFTESTKIPWVIYFIIVLLFGLPLFGIIYNLFLRIKEILKGEEDEASKY